ncbi:MAG: hypothetical protein E7379_02965 [Clostridiales bacterium]|nr:hypothetical protein [Clostridiales bacterium]
MAKRKSARSKFTLAVFLLVFSLIAITGALIGVYAATMQSMDADFNIKYEVGQNIAAKVSAYYQIQGENIVEMGDIQYDINSVQQIEQLGQGHNIALTADKTYVDFTYTFENASTSQGVQVISSWASFSDDLANINCSYIISTGSTTEWTTLSSSSDFSQMTLVLQPEATHYIRIRFAVDKTTLNAYVASSADNGLSFTLEYLEV